jgi:iron complex outermembrane receptor protein
MNYKTLGLSLLFLGSPLVNISAQEGDTAKIYDLKNVVISATKTGREILSTPVRISNIPVQSIRSAPILNSDDILKGVSGLMVTRNLGIFDKHATVSLRGVGKEQARTLILVDGVPINKLSTGSASFGMINQAMLDRVEIVKGPNSNIFGGNAMGGSVNYISRDIKDGFRMHLQSDYGSFNTVGTRVFSTYGKKGFFVGVNGFIRKSDGYNSAQKIDSTTLNMSLNEKIGGVILGYGNDKLGTIKAEFNYTDALKGKGERLYTNRGVVDGFNHYINKNYRLSWNRISGNSSMNVTGYISTEDYSEIKWKGSDIFDVVVDRRDYGAWASYNYSGLKNNSISAGIEFKGGSVDGRDIYRTSTDRVINKGKSNSIAIFLQDEISLVGGKLLILPSLRGERVWINEGGFFIEGGTSITNFLKPYTGELVNSIWSSLSPKLAARWSIANDSRVYASASRGFRPGSLEDMTRTGSISGGVILANTSLRPEYINTYEVGADFKLADRLYFSPSLYYSRGTDFHYAVNTGQTIKIGNKNRPLMSMQNVGKVEIAGGEADLNYTPVTGLDLNVNYTYTHSKLIEYEINPATGSIDITGKFLTYTPKHMINGSLTWRNRYININILYRHMSSQFMNSLNLPDDARGVNNIPALDYVDLKVWRGIGNHFVLSAGATNLFGKRYIDSSGMNSLGRFLFLQLTVNL